jgi:SAM-dependent methyltransferase
MSRDLERDPSAGREPGEYLLGTDAEELRRLGFQHQVWIREAADAWERGGFVPGSRLLDLGCGPGWATLDLARLVGPSGSVTGIDVSERFVGALRRRAAALGIDHARAEVQDLEALALAPDSFDGAYARWVLCFLGDPAGAVRRVAAALRRGARLVVQDYSDYPAIQLAPGDPAFDAVIDGVVRSWREAGGDPSVASRVPAMMEEAGLRVVSVTPVARIARPGDALWSWPRTFFDSYLPGLVANGFLTGEQRDAFDRLWERRTAGAGSYFATPPMAIVVGERR